MWRRVALLLGSLLLCAVLLEAGLRVAAALTRGRAREAGRDAHVVLCLGDSNTYGVYMKSEAEPYPARLEALLRESDPRAAVVNLGVPGRNSREVREEIEEALERHAPRAVVVLVGVNDSWGETEPPGGALGRFFSSLRIARLARLLLARRGPPDHLINLGEGGAEFRMEGRGGGTILVQPARRAAPPDGEAFAARLRENLAAIARAARAAGATPIFLTYGPEDRGFGAVNDAIRSFATAGGEALVDVAPAVREVERRGWYTEVYFHDGHPQARGYTMLARLVHAEILRLGLFPGTPVSDPLAGLEPEHAIPHEALARDRSSPTIRLEGELADPESLAIEIEDAPGLRFHVLLSFADPPPWAKPLRAESFEEDPLFQQSFGLSALEGAFDEEGRARVAVGSLVRGGTAGLRGARLQVAYFVQAYPGDPWVRGLSGTRAFELR